MKQEKERELLIIFIFKIYEEKKLYRFTMRQQLMTTLGQSKNLFHMMHRGVKDLMTNNVLRRLLLHHGTRHVVKLPLPFLYDQAWFDAGNGLRFSTEASERDPLDDARYAVIAAVMRTAASLRCNGTTTDASSNSFVVNSSAEIAVIVGP